jgi:uncharacterized protein (TIGR02597 family)
MKKLLFALIVCCQVAAFAQQKSGISTVTAGQQYLSVGANATAVVAPEFQPPSVALFTIASVSTSGNRTTLTLVGTPPRDAYDAPVLVNQYNTNNATGYPVYYALVTSGLSTGSFFSVVSNTARQIVIDNQGYNLSAASIKAIDLRPYWTLETLFPSSGAGAAFIETTNSSNVMTKLILSPVTVTGIQNPISEGQRFYFSNAVKNWVLQTSPEVSAGGVPVPPGRYLYLQNTGNGTFPIDSYIAGTVLKTPFRILLYSSPTQEVRTLFSLPRASSYKLSEIGLDDLNFSSSGVGLLGDVFIVYDGQGNVSKRYYKSKTKWYAAGSNTPVNPILSAGTAFSVLKNSNYGGSKFIQNRTNK